MGTINCDIKDFRAEERLVLEHVVGQPLLPHQRLVIQVVDLAAASPDKQQPLDVQEQVPDWWKIYDGLDEAEIDRLDQAIRQRANLVRSFE